MMREFGFGDLEFLLLAARWTVGLSLIAFLGGGLVGFIFAVLRIAPNRLLSVLSAAYTQLFQGTPLLMQLFVVYFGLGIFGIDVPAIAAASVALTLYASAFLADIWRGCVEAVPRGQWEAATALGLSFSRRLLLVILPQAIRLAVPPTVGFLVQLVKNTSLASIIGFVELTRAGQMINNATFQPFLVFLAVAALYFAMCFPLSVLSRRLEARLAVAGTMTWTP
ncbi:MAG TPA: amino acid ABC transporter permease [Sphingomicrobium sp.]|jgi:polar amino acid transport system permease protein|nr:amino acid ABC transporter permease [Sphingomicrobium sp.]